MFAELLRDKLKADRRLRGYYDDGNGLIGVRQNSLIHWFRWDHQKRTFNKTGSTRTPQGTPYFLF